MKKLVSLFIVVFLAAQLFGQVRFNPQFGLSFQGLRNLPTGVDFTGNVGVSIGADLRLGDKFQLIPGLHYLTTASSFSGTINGTPITSTSDITTNYLKIKLLASYSLINAEIVKLRVNFGPSYDFLLSDSNHPFTQINSGEFYLQGGLGVDVLFFSVDLGYAQSLTDKFTALQGSKTNGMYLSVGVVL